MNWTELNALLKFEILATRNRKRVTVNCGLPDAKGLYCPVAPGAQLFALVQLENLSFCISKICRVPWILQVHSIELPSIFLRAQPCTPLRIIRPSLAEYMMNAVSADDQLKQSNTNVRHLVKGVFSLQPSLYRIACHVDKENTPAWYEQVFILPLK